MRKLKFNRIEPWIFYLFIALNSLPVLLFKFFPTLDGAAHLYNSSIINQLLFFSSDQIGSYFTFNPEFVPNWTSHIILSFFNLFLPGFLAEKILLIVYLTALPLSFRTLIKNISTENVLLSYLVFPFTYSFPFLLGFYNFCIALVLMLFTLAFWIKNENRLNSWRVRIILFLLLIATYFSHVFVFGLMMATISIQVAMNIIKSFIENNKQEKREIILKLVTLALLALVPIILLFLYFAKRLSGDGNTYVPDSELVNWLKNMRSLITYNIPDEEAFTRKIFYIICSLFIVGLYTRVNDLLSRLKESERKIIDVLKFFLAKSDFLLFTAIFFLLLYFKLPDSDNEAGFVSVRLGLLFFMMLCLWLANQKISKWFMIMAVLLVTYFQYQRLAYYKGEIKNLNEVAWNINKISGQIKDNSVVLPINYSGNWLHSHFSNYLGIDKPVVILENYEPTVNYFPISWNQETVPDNALADLNLKQELWLQLIHGDTSTIKKKIDYVFILGNINEKNDSTSNTVKQALEDKCTLIYNEEFYKLYEIKK